MSNITIEGLVEDTAPSLPDKIESCKAPDTSPASKSVRYHTIATRLLFPFTDPVSGSYSWVNQGGATIDTSKGGIYLEAPFNASDSFRIRKYTQAPPYKITVGFVPTLVAPGSTQQWNSLIMRESGSGKFVSFSYKGWAGTITLAVDKWTDETTYSALYQAENWMLGGHLIWLQMEDNSSNRIFRYSGDGQHFIDFFTVGDTDFCTPDEIGFGVNDNSNTYNVGMNILSWLQQ